MSVFALANQKGGVGKTTAAVNIACAVAARGKKVLICDFDPQSNATSALGVEPRQGKTVYDLLCGEAEVERCIVHTKWADVLPADIRLAAAELELPTVEEREFLLWQVLEPVREKYDFIFIDCPPSLGLLTLNGLCACDKVIVPMQCEYFALEGLTQLTATIRRVKRSMNPDIDIEGIVFTMYDSRVNLTVQVAEEVKRHFGSRVYKTPVPRNVRLSEAPSHGLPVMAYDRSCRGSVAYAAIADEFLKRNGGEENGRQTVR